MQGKVSGINRIFKDALHSNSRASNWSLVCDVLALDLGLG
jgi:hypothetical protein